jgi:hypothetical protein
MKRTLFLFLILGGLPAADVLTVNPAGSVIVAGNPPTAPAPTEVRLGGGQISAGGSVTAADAQVSRQTPAEGSQVVRGDDPRLAKAWLNFNGNVAAGTITPRAQYNIQKIEKLPDGQYSVTFATPMTNPNYIVTFAFNGIYHGLMAQIAETQMTATGFIFNVVQSGASGYKFPTNAMLVVFGN